MTSASTIWFHSSSETTTPVDPARAVRPERCRYAFWSSGGSKCITHVDAVDVQPARGDVGRDEHREPLGREVGQRLLALALAQVAVDGRGAHALLSSCSTSRSAPRLVRTKTSVLSKDRQIAAATLTRSIWCTLRKWCTISEHRLGVARHLVEDRVGEVALDQPVDRAVEGRREEQRLVGPVGDAPQHPLDLGHEAHVGHAVGLVEHQDVEARHVDLAAVAEVDEPAGRRDHQVAALAAADAIWRSMSAPP